MTKEEQIREIVYRNWKNGDEIGLYKDILSFRRSELEEIREKIEKIDVSGGGNGRRLKTQIIELLQEYLTEKV